MASSSSSSSSYTIEDVITSVIDAITKQDDVGIDTELCMLPRNLPMEPHLQHLFSIFVGRKDAFRAIRVLQHASVVDQYYLGVLSSIVQPVSSAIKNQSAPIKNRVVSAKAPVSSAKAPTKESSFDEFEKFLQYTYIRDETVSDDDALTYEEIRNEYECWHLVDGKMPKVSRGTFRRHVRTALGDSILVVHKDGKHGFKLRKREVGKRDHEDVDTEDDYESDSFVEDDRKKKPKYAKYIDDEADDEDE